MFRGVTNNNYFKNYSRYGSKGERYKRQNSTWNWWNNVYDWGKDAKGYGWKWFSTYCPLLATLYWENIEEAIKYWVIKDSEGNPICNYSPLFFKLK